MSSDQNDMGSDLDGLLNGPVVNERRGPRCTVGALIEVLEQEQPTVAAKLCEALESPRVTPKALALVMSKHGEVIKSYTVRRHRNRNRPDAEGCQCPL